jgi:hypothetical protein
MATQSSTDADALPAPPQQVRAGSSRTGGRHVPGLAGAWSTPGSLAPWLALATLGLVASLVYWIFDALPFQDLPAHAGLIAMRHRFATSAVDQRFFVLAPHLGPYSLFRFLGDGLEPLLGPLGAVRFIGMLPGFAIPAALVYARHELHGDRSPAMGYLGITLSFGLLTLFGMASYLLGVALMIVLLTLWLALLERPGGWAEVRVAALALLLFVAHGDAYVLFLLLAGVAWLASGRRRRLQQLRALVPSLAVAAWVAWIEWSSTTPSGSVAIPRRLLLPRFQGVADKLSLLVSPTLMTRTGIDIVVGLVVWALLIGAAVMTVRDLARSKEDGDGPRPGEGGDVPSRAHSRALYAGALVVAVAFLALPHVIGWFGFVDGRLVPVLLMLGAMAYRRQPLTALLRAGIDRGMPVLAWAMTALVLVASHRFQNEARGYKEVLALVPAGARLLNLPLDPNSLVFTAHPFIHYDKLVMAERPVVVSDIWFHQGSALYPTAANPALRLPPSYSESNLRTIDWPSYELGDWDYVLIRTRPDAPAPITPARLSLAMHEGGWWLFSTGRPITGLVP